MKNLNEKLRDNKIKEIIKLAKLHLLDKKDNKYYLVFPRFKLIFEKAIGEVDCKILRLNNQQMGGNYTNEIIYKGIRFITVTDEKIELNKERTKIKEKEIIFKDYLHYEVLDFYLDLSIWISKNEAKD